MAPGGLTCAEAALAGAVRCWGLNSWRTNLEVAAVLPGSLASTGNCMTQACPVNGPSDGHDMTSNWQHVCHFSLTSMV